MEVQVGIITRWDNEPTTDFPHEYSAWVDGPVVQRPAFSGDLERGVVDVQTQTRTITSEGLHDPVRGMLSGIAPPRYPPVLIAAYNADSSVLAAIQANPQYMILSVDDIGNGVPPVAENRGMDDPLPQEDFDTMATKIVALTRNVIGDEQGDQVDIALLNWRDANPEGTPKEFYLAVRRFVS